MTLSDETISARNHGSVRCTPNTHGKIASWFLDPSIGSFRESFRLEQFDPERFDDATAHKRANCEGTRERFDVIVTICCPWTSVNEEENTFIMAVGTGRAWTSGARHTFRRCNGKADVSFQSERFVYDWFADASAYAVSEKVRLFTMNLPSSARRAIAAAIRRARYPAVYLNKGKWTVKISLWRS